MSSSSSPALLVACAVLCCSAVAVVASSAAATANPAPWPPVFTAQSFTLPYGPGGVPVFAKNSYSWPQRGNRIDHAAGSYECTQFYGTPDACSLLFTATQLYGLFQNGSCCVGTF